MATTKRKLFIYNWSTSSDLWRLEAQRFVPHLSKFFAKLNLKTLYQQLNVRGLVCKSMQLHNANSIAYGRCEWLTRTVVWGFYLFLGGVWPDDLKLLSLINNLLRLIRNYLYILMFTMLPHLDTPRGIQYFIGKKNRRKSCDS